MDDLSNQLDWYKNEWQLISDELEQTRDDLQKIDEERIHFRNEAARLTNIRSELISKFMSDNHNISNRLVALSNIIDEYDIIFRKYFRLTNVKLVTNAINDLRKQGGYSPL